MRFKQQVPWEYANNMEKIKGEEEGNRWAYAEKSCCLCAREKG